MVEAELTRWRAARAAISGAGFTLHRAWRWTPGRMVAVTAAACVTAVGPALQVLAVAWLVESVAAAGSVVLPLVLVVALVGTGLVLGNVQHLLGQQATVEQQRRYQAELFGAVTRLPPQRLSEPAVHAQLQACRQELRPIAMNAHAVVQAVSALVAAATLCASVWSIDPLAGVLVVLALVPNLVGFAWAASLQSRLFVGIGQHSRRAGYLAEQLLQLRTGAELATLGSAGRVAWLMDRSQLHADRMTQRMLGQLIQGDVVSGLAGAVLLGAALASLVAGGPGGAGVAAGVVGSWPGSRRPGAPASPSATW